MSQIKINRALKRAAVGRFPGSALAMLDRIPRAVCDALTATQIAEMLDAMWGACQEAKGIAGHEAIAAGAVWNARCQVMREIV